MDDSANNATPVSDGAPPSDSGATSVSTSATEDAPGTDDVDLQARSNRRWWWQRPTVRHLKRDMQEHREYRDEWDARRNNETRLPEGDSVHLGGITLTEAFTPSTVTNLYTALSKWPRRVGSPDDDWITQLERGRSSMGGGWVNLGVVRRPGQFVMGEGFNDSTLPSHIQAVWLTLTFLVPSIAVVCATFTFEDDVADLSGLLRSDFQTVTEEVRLVVAGRLGGLRSRFPWCRPKRYTMSSRPWDAFSGKRRAVEQLIQTRENECERWFYGRFQGRFAVADEAVQPTIRLLFTEESVPFQGRDRWRYAPDLDWSPGVHRSTELKGWSLKDWSWGRDRRRYVTTIAARRSDVGDEDHADLGGQSNWSLTQRFGEEHAGLAARLSLRALLDIYSGRLARLRDSAGKTRRVRRPVHDARNLDTYLLTDGLDAATITADVGNLTKELAVFGWGVPEYTEDQGELPEGFKQRPAIELVPALCSNLQALASRLAADTANTDGNIRASAELRQAVANTRLQRTVVFFALAALVVALVSLIYR
jgi:hypothetical protein